MAGFLWAFQAIDVSGGECRLKAANGLLSGESQAQEMGQVMRSLSEKTGITVYLDNRLEKTPVTFIISEAMPAELAVRRIVKPFSYALSLEDNGASLNGGIREIWIFQKGGLRDANYRIYEAGRPSDVASDRKTESALVADDGTAAVFDTGRVIAGKDLFQRGCEIARSPFGSPVIKNRRNGKGSDYRTGPEGMKRAYAASRLKQKNEKDREQQSIRREQHRKELQRRKEHQDRRNRAIRQIINQKEGQHDPKEGQYE